MIWWKIVAILLRNTETAVLQMVEGGSQEEKTEGNEVCLGEGYFYQQLTLKKKPMEILADGGRLRLGLVLG